MLGKRQRARGEARGKERSKARGNARGNIQEARCNKERRLGVVGNCIDSGLRLFRSYDIPKLKDELVRLHKCWLELFRVLCKELYKHGKPINHS